MTASPLEHAPLPTRAALLIAAAGVPLIYSPSFINISVPKLSLLLVLVPLAATFRIAQLVREKGPHSFDRLMWPAIAASVGLLVAWAVSSHRTWSLVGDLDRMQGLIPGLLCIALGVLIADAFTDRRRDIAIAMVVAGAIVGFYGLLQAINADPFIDQNPAEFAGPPATLGNPNFSGAFLAMVLPLCIALWFELPKYRNYVAVAGALVAGCLYATNSQGPWAAAVAALLVFVALSFSLSNRTRAALLVGAGLTAAAVAGVVLVDMRASDPPAIDTTSWERSQLWVASGRMIKEKPILGWGTEGFQVDAVTHRTLEDALYWDIRVSDQPHNVYLGAAVSAGVVGFAALAVLVYWVVARIRRLESGDIMGAAFAAGAVAYLVAGLVSIDQLAIRAPFWAFLAGLSIPPQVVVKKARAKSKRAQARETPRVAYSPVVLAAGGVVTLVFLVWAAMVASADLTAGSGSKDLAAGRLDSGFEKFESATSWWSEFDYPTDISRALASAIVSNPEELAAYGSEIDDAFSYIEDFPDVQAVTAYADVMYALRATDESFRRKSLETWRFALERDPQDPIVRVRVADILTEAGDAQGALDVLEPLAQYMDDPRLDFLDGRSSNWPARYHGARAAALLELGDTSEAAEAARAALELDPDEPRALRVLEQT